MTMTTMLITTLQEPIAPPPPAESGAPAARASGASGTPDSRSTTFVPVEGGSTEQHSGSTLLVEAYAVLWVILMTWLFMLWRKQARLHTRLDDLERVLDRAAAAQKK